MSNSKNTNKHEGLGASSIAIGFIADLLYYHNLIDAKTINEIYDAKNVHDLGQIIERIENDGNPRT